MNKVKILVNGVEVGEVEAKVEAPVPPIHAFSSCVMVPHGTPEQVETWEQWAEVFGGPRPLLGDELLAWRDKLDEEIEA